MNKKPQAVEEGDSKALLSDFPRFYDAYEKRIRATAFRMVGREHTDDLVQEIFLKIWKGRKKFHGNSALSTWVYRVAIHASIDFARKTFKRNDVEFTPSMNPTPERTDIMEREIVEKAMAKLEAKERAIVVLALVEGWSLSEIADLLEIPLGTAKSKFHYAKKNLQESLERMGVVL